MIRKDSSVIQPTLKLLSYFFSRIEINPDIVHSGTPCWLWAVIDKNSGYGRFKQKGVVGFAHVIACRMFAGPIPEDLSCDHLCRRRNCVNPVHVEYVPIGVNILRGTGPAAHNSRQQQCIRGHEFDYATSTGARGCRECLAIGEKRRTVSRGGIPRNQQFCRRAHAFTPENTIHRKGGSRSCRRCRVMKERERRRKARALQPDKRRSQWTHCKNGHPFDETNTAYRNNGGRRCRKCTNEKANAYRKALAYYSPQRIRLRAQIRESYHRNKSKKGPYSQLPSLHRAN